MNIIAVLHFLFVVYVVTVPFVVYSSSILGLHAVILISLLIHWYLNNDECVLTLLESKLFPDPNNNRDKLFFQRLMGPIYNINNTHIYGYTVLLLFVTIYQYLKYLK